MSVVLDLDEAVSEPRGPRGTRNEVYLGEDKDRIRDWLDGMRSEELSTSFIANHLQRVKRRTEPPNLRTVYTLDDFLEERPEDAGFNFELFDEVVRSSAEAFSRIHPGFDLLESRSYVVGIMEDDSEDMGGFHSDSGIGFQYLSHFAYSSLLGTNTSQDPDVRALEFARSYLHDSLHAATYRSFALGENDQPFRWQYGFNFRREDGTSYSGGDLTKETPYAINLNLLMDGLIVEAVSEAMRPYCDRIAERELNETEEDLLAELGGGHDRVKSLRIRKFADGVVEPTRRFLEYWGDTSLRDELLRGMLSGEMQPLVQYFEGAVTERADDPGLNEYLARRIEQSDRFERKPSWVQLFASPDYLAGKD